MVVTSGLAQYEAVPLLFKLGSIESVFGAIIDGYGLEYMVLSRVNTRVLVLTKSWGTVLLVVRRKKQGGTLLVRRNFIPHVKTPASADFFDACRRKNSMPRMESLCPSE